MVSMELVCKTEMRIIHSHGKRSHERIAKWLGLYDYSNGDMFDHWEFVGYWVPAKENDKVNRIYTFYCLRRPNGRLGLRNRNLPKD